MSENKKRNLTKEESWNIIQPIIEREPFIKIGEHSPYPHHDFGENVYRMIVNVMSLDMLINLMEHEKIYNVYFTPSAPPPEFGVDGITMAYKVYVKYHQVES